MASTTAAIKAWDVWYAEVKFEESNEAKDRPILIRNNREAFVIAFKMTSTDRGDSDTEHRLRNWKEAGLEHETSVNLNKILKIETVKLRRKIGTLTEADRMLIQIKLAKR